MTTPGQTNLPLLAGFALPVVAAIGMSAALMGKGLPPPDPAAIEEAEFRSLNRLHIEMQAPIFVSVGVGPRLRIHLAMTVAGSGAELARLNAHVAGDLDRISAAILIEAEALVREGATAAMVHDLLPERARDAVNRIAGMEDFPEPVEEVLITQLFVV